MSVSPVVTALKPLTAFWIRVGVVCVILWVAFKYLSGIELNLLETSGLLVMVILVTGLLGWIKRIGRRPKDKSDGVRDRID